MFRLCDTQDMKFHLVTPGNLSTFVGPQALHPNYLKVPQIALRVGCMRAALLAVQIPSATA